VSKVRYVTASKSSRAWWDDLYQLDSTPIGFDRVQVLETGSDPYPTGLLDAQGNELFRLSEKRSIGFWTLREE
jgi:hypothetical protein